VQGRFTSIDPTLLSAKSTMPQSWNRYAYTLNNPLRFVDPTGGIPQQAIQDIVTAYEVRPGTSSMTRQAGFFVRHQEIALKIGSVQRGSTNISTVATRFAARIGLEENAMHEGSQVNAFRHVLWQAKIATSFGQSIARQVGAAHEENPRVD